MTDPDPYLLEALSNPGRLVFVRSWEDTKFTALLETYQTNNVEYNGAYYTVDLVSVDTLSYGVYFLILLISWIVLVVSFTISRRPLSAGKRLAA